MRHLKFTIIILLLLFLTSCEKDAEVQPREYPYVITNSPTVNSNGVEFSADLTNIGNQKIIEYGFVWDTKPKPTIQNYKKTFDDYKPNKGIYTYSINYGFIKGEGYFVRAYVLTTQNIIYGNEKSFISEGSLPPVIDDFEPKFGRIGTKVTIKGKNFTLIKDSNTVKFGNIKVIIDSVSEHKMIVEIPPIVKPEKVKITIETAGMKTKSKDFFDLWFPWIQKKAISLGSLEPTYFTIDNTGYFINSNSTTMAAYNPIEDRWQTNIELPQNSGKYPLAIVIDNKAYVLFDNNLWVYNKNENIWKQKKSFPGYRGHERGYTFIMSVGNSFGVGSLNVYPDPAANPKPFWVYNIVTDEWEQKENLPKYRTGGALFSCKILDKSYLAVVDQLWEYDLKKDTWILIDEFPKGIRLNKRGGYVIIDNELYITLGDKNREMWKYEIGNKKWIKYHGCPASFIVCANFSINNKGYLLTASDYYAWKTNSVWEFDPSKN